MSRDKISKPKPGFSFPIPPPEARKKLSELAFEMYDYKALSYTRAKRPDLILASGDKPLEYGYPLACWRRHYDIAIFSLPDDIIPNQTAAAALDLALSEFSKIDRTPEESTKQSHFFIYRAYIGELGKVTITKDQLSNLNYLEGLRAIDPRKRRGKEKVIRELQP